MERRRRIVVDRTQQSRIIVATVWVPGLCLAATSLLLGFYGTSLHSEALQVDMELPSIMPVFLISAAFMLVATSYMLFSALRFSHRIAGPVRNMEVTLSRFRNGDIRARVHLRKHDYLVDAAEHLNNFLDWLEENPPAGYEARSREETKGTEAPDEELPQETGTMVAGGSPEEGTEDQD